MQPYNIEKLFIFKFLLTLIKVKISESNCFYFILFQDKCLLFNSSEIITCFFDSKKIEAEGKAKPNDIKMKAIQRLGHGEETFYGVEII